MYDHIYDKMVAAKVAIKLDVPVMLDENGVEVINKNDAPGLPTMYKITCPQNIVFVDETGKNTNMK